MMSLSLFQVFSLSGANSMRVSADHDRSHIFIRITFIAKYRRFTCAINIHNVPLSIIQKCAKADKTNSICLPLLCVYMLRVHVNINTTCIYHELTFTQHTWVGRITNVSWLGEIWGVWLLCTAYYDLCFVLLIMTFGGWVQSAIAPDDRFEPDL